MTPEDLAITFILTAIGVTATVYVSRYYYIKSMKARKRRRRILRRRSDSLTVNLDLAKPNLGLTEQKAKKIGLAWIVNKLFSEKKV